MNAEDVEATFPAPGFRLVSAKFRFDSTWVHAYVSRGHAPMFAALGPEG